MVMTGEQRKQTLIAVKIMVGEIQGPRGSWYTNYITTRNKLLSLVESFNSRVNYYYLE
jgi:hypothetical protein